MKSNFGDCFQLSLFGESHSDAIGVVIGGLAAGIELDLDFIDNQLEKRRPHGKISTQRHEGDKIELVSGYFNGKTTGTPLCIMIRNENQRSGDYERTKNIPRPSHADFTANEKYGGFQDYRGGGHFSGRITAPLVVAGAIAAQLLLEHGITVASHIKELYGFLDAPFSSNEEELLKQADLLNDSIFPVIDRESEKSMTELIEKAAAQGDSLGGVLETVILNLPTGLGEPFFNSVESKLSSLLFSIPGVKGVSFGDGFDITRKTGSEANDALTFKKNKDGQSVIRTKTNNNGGINGGITNGMPVLFSTAIKPTPSIYKEQQSVDLVSLENTSLIISGRHDPAIIHRARVVVDSCAAIAILDLFCERYGTQWTSPEK